jgi:hypothetical protein
VSSGRILGDCGNFALAGSRAAGGPKPEKPKAWHRKASAVTLAGRRYNANKFGVGEGSTRVRSSNSARLRSWSSEAFAAAAKKPITALLFLVVLLAEPVSSSRAEDPSIPSGAVDGHVVCDDGSPARLATVFLLPLARYLPKEQQGLVPPAPDPSYTDLDGYYSVHRRSTGRIRRGHSQGRI